MDAECIAMRNLVLIKDGKVRERHTYGMGDMPFPRSVRAHMRDGGTRSLRQLQTVKPALTRMRHDIQQETGCLAHINACLTPPGGQGPRCTSTKRRWQNSGGRPRYARQNRLLGSPSPSDYPPIEIKHWLDRPVAHIATTFTDLVSAVDWLKGELSAMHPVDAASFSIEDRVAYSHATLRQAVAADAVYGYYAQGGSFVSRTLISCPRGAAAGGGTPLPGRTGVGMQRIGRRARRWPPGPLVRR